MAIIVHPRSIRFIQLLRMAVVVFMAGAGLIFLRGTYGADARYVVDVPLGGLALAYVISIVWLLRASEIGRPIDENPLYVQVFLDVFLMGMVVFYTGATSSNLQLIFLLPVILASAFLYLRGSLFAASLSTLMLAAIYLLDGSGLLRDYGAPYLQTAVPFDFVASVDAISLLANALLTVLALLLAAFISGYVAENQLKILGELGEVSRRLERIRLDTSDVLEHLESGLITVDGAGEIIYFNRAATDILQPAHPDPPGHHFREVFSGRLHPLGELVELWLAGRRPSRRNEVTIEVPGGPSIPLGVSPSILRSGQGIRGVVLIFQDLTEAKLLEEKIRLQDRLAVIGELSAGIAHELRNPLASISGSAEMLQEDLPAEGENRRLLQLVVKESQRLNEIVEEFLNYARMEQAQRMPVDLSAIIEDVCTLARNHPSYGEGRQVRYELEGCPPVLADTGQMKQVFLNLVLNALEAFEGAGQVRIRCPGPGEGRSMGPGMVEVWVQDDGPGIPLHEAERIFEPFYTSKRGGTGLGLAVVQRIVENHDGRILYAPSADGQTTFRIYLPQGGPAA